MSIRLVIFDVDGTILQAYSWQYIHQKLGTWNQAKKYKQQFFADQITYQEWARLDTALWKDESMERIQQIISRIPCTRGAKQTLKTLKDRGIRTYLLSAGLTQAAERIQRETDAVDGYLANKLKVKNSILTGEVEVNVSFNDKNRHLPRILRQFDLKPRDCAAVGDDPTLIPLFKKVALAIAFNPTDEAVAKHADITVKSGDLRDILPHILGHR
jgi:phosphoserine phosphatase